MTATRIPDAVMAMRRDEAFAYYVRELHLSDTDARTLVAETHRTAFRDLDPADDDRARVAAEMARYPETRSPRPRGAAAKRGGVYPTDALAVRGRK